ncbi:MAG TPA: YetF domain-containing protein [Candidatus Saccharimonadales bacterium]|nr:YetF domain-containing protein [Candidatus Saccharimonadales bacterium]
MNSVLRAAFIYVFLLVMLRLSGKRTLSEMTTFDFILLLIIGESTQQALLGDDFSLVNAVVVITTLITIDIMSSLLKQRSDQVEKWLEGAPLIILENGQPLKDRMIKERVDESDILQAARSSQGLERLDQIKYAVLEKSGGISIVPK